MYNWLIGIPYSLQDTHNSLVNYKDILGIPKVN